MTLRSLFRFLDGVEFGTTTVAAPNLSGIAKAVDTLPEEERAKFYAGFLDQPSITVDGKQVVEGISHDLERADKICRDGKPHPFTPTGVTRTNGVGGKQEVVCTSCGYRSWR